MEKNWVAKSLGGSIDADDQAAKEKPQEDGSFQLLAMGLGVAIAKLWGNYNVWKKFGYETPQIVWLAKSSLPTGGGQASGK